MFVRVFFTKSWLVVNKVFGLRFGEQSNGYSRGKNKAGLIAHTYTQRQTQMQTHSQGTITDQKHQSSNHTHYIHVLAIPSSLLTSPCVWLKLVCVCKHTQCICECVCAWTHLSIQALCGCDSLCECVKVFVGWLWMHDTDLMHHQCFSRQKSEIFPHWVCACVTETEQE